MLLLDYSVHATEQAETSLCSAACQLTNGRCSRLLLGASRAAIDRYLLAAGPNAANPLQRRVAVK